MRPKEGDPFRGSGEHLVGLGRMTTTRMIRKVCIHTLLYMTPGEHLLAVRIEWCKARARAHRWSEECDLLQEEMRRVVAFFEWQAKWWQECSRRSVWTGRTDASGRPYAHSSEHDEGRKAYALRQSGLRSTLAESCREAWKGTDMYLTLGELL